MKLMKQIGSIVVVGALLFSLTACGGKKAKKISGEDFTKELEGMSYSVADLSEYDEDSKTNIMASNEDGTILYTYYEFNSTQDADKFFDDGYEQMSTVKEMPDYSGKINKSGDKFTVNATFKDDEGNDSSTYIVCVKAEDMVIVALTENNSDEVVKSVDKTIDTLCYTK